MNAKTEQLQGHRSPAHTGRECERPERFELPTFWFVAESISHCLGITSEQNAHQDVFFEILLSLSAREIIPSFVQIWWSGSNILALLVVHRCIDDAPQLLGVGHHVKGELPVEVSVNIVRHRNRIIFVQAVEVVD